MLFPSVFFMTLIGMAALNYEDTQQYALLLKLCQYFQL